MFNDTGPVFPKGFRRFAAVAALINIGLFVGAVAVVACAVKWVIS